MPDDVGTCVPLVPLCPVPSIRLLQAWECHQVATPLNSQPTEIVTLSELFKCTKLEDYISGLGSLGAHTANLSMNFNYNKCLFEGSLESRMVRFTLGVFCTNNNIFISLESD